MLLRDLRRAGSGLACRRRRLVAAVAVAALVALAGAGQARGAAAAVCLSGPPACNYSDIQAAIESAAQNGDTIKIAACSYSCALNIDGKNLSLKGAGADTTTIDGDGGRP